MCANLTFDASDFTADNTFSHEFDLTERNLDELEIKETKDQTKCFIWDSTLANTAYNSFVLTKNTQSKIICEISLYKSSKTKKYLPRPTFKRLKLNGELQISNSEKSVIIALGNSEDALNFWKLVGFLNSYKNLVETDEFDESYTVVSKDKYFVEFEDKSIQQKMEDLKELINIADLSTSDIKSLTFENRKKNLRGFFKLLKNPQTQSGKSVHKYYRDKFGLPQGEENIWHYFLKKHDWILGLNADLKFVREFLDEQKVGCEDSKGRGSPQLDLLGISDFTVLVELKHSNTKIFKKSKSKGRANTWDFTSDFIEGISQCLGQKFELEKSYDGKAFIKDDDTRLDKSQIQTIDPKSVFILGNKSKEFPINQLSDENLTKNKTLERFRRNNRNIDVITYDELFERAYHIVFSKKLNKSWFNLSVDQLFED